MAPSEKKQMALSLLKDYQLLEARVLHNIDAENISGYYASEEQTELLSLVRSDIAALNKLINGGN